MIGGSVTPTVSGKAISGEATEIAVSTATRLRRSLPEPWTELGATSAKAAASSDDRDERGPDPGVAEQPGEARLARQAEQLHQRQVRVVVLPVRDEARRQVRRAVPEQVVRRAVDDHDLGGRRVGHLEDHPDQRCEERADDGCGQRSQPVPGDQQQEGRDRVAAACPGTPGAVGVPGEDLPARVHREDREPHRDGAAAGQGGVRGGCHLLGIRPARVPARRPLRPVYCPRS